MTLGPLVVTYAHDARERAVVAEVLGDATEVVWLTELTGPDRTAALQRAAVVLARNTGQELGPDEAALIGGARLLQFVTAGVDHIPLTRLPSALPIAANRGGYAEPMAEHALAMALAAAKRLLVEHAALATGAFNQFTPNRMLAGGVCAILGYGGIGRAVARLMRAIGMRIHALNRHGAGDDLVDWMGGSDRLDALLAAADVLVIAAPLTPATRGLIGAPELARMKDDAILINLARGEIVDEAALYRHLQAHPRFTACLDAWWIEPVRHGAFRMDQPFLGLPNVIGSPHNSATVAGSRETALRRALENCRRVLAGEMPRHLVGDDERMR
ncbi:MAG: hydroxyacid dehydrogenase [Proteobacteria bacterium]|nr:hydroxyacid dehydrogenase [Pseudomonadota bacterium]